MQRTSFLSGRPRLLLGVLVAISLIAMSLMLGTTTPLHAANAGIAPPLVEHCNDVPTAPGGELVCSIAAVNYLNADGTLAAAPPSTVTTTVCAGPAGAPVCTAPVVTVLLTPVTTARQCNDVLYGGGSTIRCTATIINHWASDPLPSLATIFQCVGSPITGPGAPGTCAPLAAANTAASTPFATVGQCNGSGYGGGTPVLGFNCTVAASTTTTLLPIHVDQCNGSAYGGGSIVICSATVTNDVLAVATPVPAVPDEETPAAAAVPSVVVPTVVAPPLLIPSVVASPTVPQVFVPSIQVPTATPSVTATVQVPTPTATVLAPPVIVPPVTGPPLPPATGNAGLVGQTAGAPASFALLVFSVVTLGLLSRRLTSPRPPR